MLTDGAITNRNAHRPSSNLTVSGLFPWTPKSGNEDFHSVIQQMAQVRFYLVVRIFSFILPVTG